MKPGSIGKDASFFHVHRDNPKYSLFDSSDSDEIMNVALIPGTSFGFIILSTMDNLFIYFIKVYLFYTN